MRRYLPLLIAVLTLRALLLPATAEAHGRHFTSHGPSTNPTALALAAAESYWHAKPCGGTITLAVATAPSLQQLPAVEGNDEGGNVSAWSTWSNPGGPPADDTGCVITLNRQDWPNWKVMDENYQEYCDVMTHEVGHFLGYEDEATTNPESIEYPIIGYENMDSVPQCRGITLYYGHETFHVESPAEAECEERAREAARAAGKEAWASCVIKG